MACFVAALYLTPNSRAQWPRQRSADVPRNPDGSANLAAKLRGRYIDELVIERMI
jgi:hypothetical protein